MNPTKDKIHLANAALRNIADVAKRMVEKSGSADAGFIRLEAEAVLFLLSPSAAERDQQPTADDLKYSVLGEASINEHLSEVSELDPSRMVEGRSYTLTSGQRAWLREVYDMTPARTVTIIELAFWPGTRCPQRLTLRSDEHVDNSRKHVLVMCAITSVGRFFTESKAKEQEKATAVRERSETGTSVGGRKKVQTLSDLLDELAGV